MTGTATILSLVLVSICDANSGALAELKRLAGPAAAADIPKMQSIATQPLRVHSDDVSQSWSFWTAVEEFIKSQFRFEAKDVEGTWVLSGATAQGLRLRENKFTLPKGDKKGLVVTGDLKVLIDDYNDGKPASGYLRGGEFRFSTIDSAAPLPNVGVAPNRPRGLAHPPMLVRDHACRVAAEDRMLCMIQSGHSQRVGTTTHVYEYRKAR